jgi:hypothetical protein
MMVVTRRNLLIEAAGLPATAAISGAIARMPPGANLILIIPQHPVAARSGAHQR